MNMINTSVRTIKQNATCTRIYCNGNLTGSEANLIRKEITDCIAAGSQTIYLDTKEVNNADLSGINEIIHSAYTTANTKNQFILIYKSGSVVEKWVNTTGLDKFLTTAIIPAA
jgi:anti-anti-sigma factor